MDVEVYVRDYAPEHVSISVKAALDVVTVAPLVLEDVVEIVDPVALEGVPVDVDLDVRMDVDPDVLHHVEEIVPDVRNPVLADAPIHVLETVLMDVPIHAIRLVRLVKAVLAVALDVRVVALLDALVVLEGVVVVVDQVAVVVQT